MVNKTVKATATMPTYTPGQGTPTAALVAAAQANPSGFVVLCSPKLLGKAQYQPANAQGANAQRYAALVQCHNQPFSALVAAWGKLPQAVALNGHKVCIATGLQRHLTYAPVAGNVAIMPLA